MLHVHDRPRSCNLTAQEAAELNDIYHELGCGCPECRPDLHEDGGPIAHEAFGSPEAA